MSVEWGALTKISFELEDMMVDEKSMDSCAFINAAIAIESVQKRRPAD